MCQVPLNSLHIWQNKNNTCLVFSLCWSFPLSHPLSVCGRVLAFARSDCIVLQLCRNGRTQRPREGRRGRDKNARLLPSGAGREVTWKARKESSEQLWGIRKVYGKRKRIIKGLL